MQEKRSNADRSNETRDALLKAARHLFETKGFAATGTPELVKAAGVTRGALYHHFADKQTLFQAVVKSEAAAIAAEIEAGSTDAQTPLDALLEGARAYFEVMQHPGRIRLMILDGPAVLGPEVMRQIDLETGGGELRQGIEAALAGKATSAEAAVLADLISAMFERAVVACAAGADRRSYEQSIDTLLSRLVTSD